MANAGHIIIKSGGSRYKGSFVKVYSGEYNNGLGARIGSRQDVVDARNRIKDETGTEVIEIGNENPRVRNKKVSYKPTRAEAEKMFQGMDIDG